MTVEAKTLPLGGLSDAEKDDLIERLWRDLQSERARADALADRLAQAPGRTPGEEDLLKRLQEAGHRRADSPPKPAEPGLPANLRFLRSKGLLLAVGVLALAFALDFALGRYQARRLDQKRLADLELQHTAYEGMFTEVETVTYEPDGKSYRVRLKLTNISGGKPIYVMLSPVRVFEQSGFIWQEVPTKDPARRVDAGDQAHGHIHARNDLQSQRERLDRAYPGLHAHPL